MQKEVRNGMMFVVMMILLVAGAIWDFDDWDDGGFYDEDFKGEW